jgi:hypothetical protein
MKSAGTTSPLLGNRFSISTMYLHSSSMAPIRRKLKAGGIDDAVEFVFFTIRYDAFLGDSINSLALCIHELHRRYVERWKILIVKARPLTELIVVWLQALCRIRILHDLVDARPDLLHLLEIGHLPSLGELFGTCCVSLLGAHQELPQDVGPPVRNQVDISILLSQLRTYTAEGRKGYGKLHSTRSSDAC